MAELSGKVALVTGTAHGIGTAIADGLEQDGATVHRVDRDTADLADPGQVARLVEHIGPIDVLVNNAGGVAGQVGRPLDEISDDDWRAIVDANLTSTFLCTRAVIPAMKAARAGRIVNISSGAGRSVSLTGIQAYASAKAGQIGFTRQMAHELGPFGITVNCIAPGFVRSNPTTERQWQSYGEEGQRRLTEVIALRGPEAWMVGRDAVRRRLMPLAADGKGDAGGQVRFEVPHHERAHLARTLLRHETAADLRVCFVRRDGLAARPLVPAPHAVHFQRRTYPLTLERVVAGLADRRGRAHLREKSRFVER